MTDDKAPDLICDGCGCREPDLNALRQRYPGAIACCPERKMRPIGHADIDAAVKAERERCADIAGSMSIPIEGTPYQAGGRKIAAAIRAEGGEPNCPNCDLPHPSKNPFCFCKKDTQP